MSDFKVLQSRQKGKKHAWSRMQENNHVYIPVAQVYISMQHTQIEEPVCTKDSLTFSITIILSIIYSLDSHNILHPMP